MDDTEHTSGSQASSRTLVGDSQEPGSDRSRPPPARRRDKPQLSCNSCRARKVRCDRQRPCNYCRSRGISASCRYAPGRNLETLKSSPDAKNAQSRIDELENLVLNLMQQATPGVQTTENISGEASQPGVTQDPACIESTAEASHSGNQDHDSEAISLPEHGRMQVASSGARYLSSVHWAAVLDGIAGLREYIELEDDLDELMPQALHASEDEPNPLLLYGSSLPITELASILDALPPPLIMDRLVSQYFTVLDMTPGVPHRSKFQREYKAFRESPYTVPVTWVGLLFSILALSMHYQQLFRLPAATQLEDLAPSPGTQAALDTYREMIVHCLHLGSYTKGGPHVMETLLLYFMVEASRTKSTSNGLWILAGNLVQIAMHSGYHQDSKHFSNISPFDGEMRRRIWAQIRQLECTISAQLGLPGLIRESQTDTAEPGNLTDSDFDENISELPPARPETDTTPMLYIAAKVRLLSFAVKVAGIVTDVREPQSYTQVLQLDSHLSNARNVLPTALRWDGLESCITVSAQVLIQRMWLEVSIQRLHIVLHKKYLIASRHQAQYAYSRSACLTAALRVLGFQHLIDDEINVDGRLYQSRWKAARFFVHDFLLATSTLCFYINSHYEMQRDVNSNALPSAGADDPDVETIKQMLRKSQQIWLRESVLSKEARKAVAALRYVLDDLNDVTMDFGGTEISEFSLGAVAMSSFPGLPDLMSGHDSQGLGMDPAYGSLFWQQIKPNSRLWDESNVLDESSL